MTTATTPDTERLRAVAREELARFAPPPDLTVSAWADRFRIVPSYSAEPGRWVTHKTPYLRDVMDTFNDPTVNKVVFMKCARIGATEAGLNIIGYFIDHEPSPIFIVQPAVDDAKDFSKEQLTPTIEETECLRVRVADAASRESGNTITAKIFPGGALYLVGANSPRGFRRRTARLIVLEEVDGYPPSAGTEGDQVKLAERRATTFQHRRKIYLNSTPTVKGASRIEAEFEASDQRRYFVPCPDCAHRQVLVWGQLRWKDLDAPHYCCIGCGSLIPESAKFRMVQEGTWVATNPGPSVVGFHINAMYSPWISWKELREEWEDAQGSPEKLQVFVNTALGETWEDRGSLSTAVGLEARRVPYAQPIPEGVVAVTVGCDVQPDRLEAVARGWGRGEESWYLERAIFLGDSTVPETTPGSVWAQFTEFRKRWGAQATCVDSGYNPDAVYSYCKPRWSEKVYATRGHSKPGQPLVNRRPSSNNKARCRVFYIGTDAAKDSIYGRLNVAVPGPLFWHFALVDHCSRDYFEQLTAERRVRKQSGGKWIAVYECPPGRRNEVLDCEVGALVALRLLNPKLDGAPVRPIEAAAPAPIPKFATAPESAPVAPVAPAGRIVKNLRPRGGGFVNRW